MAQQDICQSNYVRGVAVLIEVQDAATGEYSKVAAQRGGTLNRSADTLDASSKEDYGWANNEAGIKSWSIDCDGLFVENNQGFNDLNAAWVNGDCVRVRVRFPSGLTYVGQAIITDFPIDFPYDDAVTYSLTFEGKGALVSAQTTPTVLPKSITLGADKTSVAVGEKANLTVTFVPENTSDKSVSYVSLNPLVATVDEAGAVTGVKAGTATINARSNANSAVTAVIDITVTTP